MNTWRSDKQKLATLLCYQGIFNCGLSKEDIANKCGWGNMTVLAQHLDELESAKVIKRVNNYYFLSSIDPNLLGVSMDVRATDSEKLIRAGDPFYKFLQLTGCVTLIAVSGSAAHANVVNTDEKESDLDIFLVCKPASIHIVRVIVALYARFRKVARLFGRVDHPKYCVNTLMDTKSLEVQNRSIFTAFDLLNLRIITGEQTFHLLKNKNAWTQKYFDSKVSSDQKFKDTEITASPLASLINWLLFILLALRSSILARLRGSDTRSISFSTAYASDKRWCLYHQNHLGGGHQPAIARRFAKIYSENFEEDPELFEFLFPDTSEKGTWTKRTDGSYLHSESVHTEETLGYR